MEVAGDAREEMSHGSVGRQFADVAVGVVKGLAVSAGELSKIVELRRERFENEMRGDEARQAHLKELLREWFTLTAKHWTTTSLSLPTMARLFDDQTFKGFQSYGKLSQLLSHIERLNMHTRGLYSCDVGYLARFCEYEGR